MKLRRLCAALMVVAIGSSVTASAVTFQQKTVQAAGNSSSCPTAQTISVIPDLSDVLRQVSCKQGTSTKTSVDSLANLPDCFRELLERCGFSVNGSTGTPSTGESSSSSSTSSSSSSQASSSTPSSIPSSSSSSQASSSTPASSSQASSSSVSSAKPSDTLTYEERVVELVNQERAKAGLKPLTMNLKLSDVARAKSQDMHDKNYFSHTSPTYGSPFDMMKQFGISYRTAGENIAMGYRTPEAVMEGWMNSSGHRANILNGSFTEIGVGYVADGSYWTQQFIG